MRPEETPGSGGEVRLEELAGGLALSGPSETLDGRGRGRGRGRSGGDGEGELEGSNRSDDKLLIGGGAVEFELPGLELPPTSSWKQVVNGLSLYNLRSQLGRHGARTPKTRSACSGRARDRQAR